MGHRKSRNSEPFEERECKLDAQSVEQLQAIRRYILTNSHYVTLEDPSQLHPMMRNMIMLDVPQQVTAPRIRVYFDTLSLDGFRNGVEIRVEAKESGRAPYKQTIKIGSNTVDKNNECFNRLEYAAGIGGPSPDLTLAGKAAEGFLKEAFDSKRLSSVRLYPMVMMASQRWRVAYRPDGKKDTLIEYAHDTGRGVTFTDFAWDQFEAELEMKEGNPSHLHVEEKLLMKMFNFLTRGLESKPSPGFRYLEDSLANDEAAVRFLKKSCQSGEFKLFAR